jgi:glycosyltransferase involved in cell wall biosynthesis
VDTARIPASPPAFKPRPANETRPLWSVMIPAFNCGAYLGDALQSVLAQAPSSQAMQIAVMDDASTDINVRQLVQSIGGGRVEYYRHDVNMGSVATFNQCIELAKGHYVHLLHGDDRVLPGYYAAIEVLFKNAPSAGMFISRWQGIGEHGQILWTSELEAPAEGILNGWLERISMQQPLQYAATTMRREVYETVGGYYGVNYGEDWEMWVRVAARYPVAYTPQILAQYRVHQASISSKKVLAGDNLRDIAWVIDTIQSHVPEQLRARARATALANSASYGVEVAETLWREQANKPASIRQAQLALAMHSDATLLKRVVDLYAEMLSADEVSGRGAA